MDLFRRPYRLPRAAGYIGIGLIVAVLGWVAVYKLQWSESAVNVDAPGDVRSMTQVVALGRIAPVSEVINVSTPLMLEGDRIAKLEVAMGDVVKQGQLLAVLDSQKRLETLLQQAEGRIQVAKQQLLQIQAGSQRGEIVAQQATVAQLEAALSGEVSAGAAALVRRQAELNNATAEFGRFDALYRSGAISASEREAKRLVLERAQAQLVEADAEHQQTVNTLQAQISGAIATLDRVVTVRPEDVAVAQAELKEARAAAAVIATELEQAYIRAPIAGKVLQVFSYPGEQVANGQGLVELGQTEQMMVIAEVDESDIRHIQIGQSATVTGDAFDDELRGQVSTLGQAVRQQSVLSQQPGSNIDTRVVEVRIVLSPEDSKKVENLTHLQVQVGIPTTLS